jgi:hypothetical protein
MYVPHETLNKIQTKTNRFQMDKQNKKRSEIKNGAKWQ